MTETLALPQLASWLHEEMTRHRDQSTVVLAGHFAIFSSGATASDLLDDPTPPAGAREMLAFTRQTWLAAVDVLAKLATPSSAGIDATAHTSALKPQQQLLLLADDLQFVRPVLADRGASERLAAALAAGWHGTHATLPAFHEATLRQRHLDVGVVMRATPQRTVFSERELRIAAVQRLRERAHEPDAHGLALSDGENRIDVALPELEPYCLVHSGRTTCAGGYLELLNQLAERGVERLIALVPYRCLGQVTVGAALARRLFSPNVASVTTVAMPADGTDLPAAVVRDDASPLRQK